MVGVIYHTEVLILRQSNRKQRCRYLLFIKNKPRGRSKYFLFKKVSAYAS